MASDSKSTLMKLKPSTQHGSSKLKFDSSITKKKIADTSIKRPLDSKTKPISTFTSISTFTKSEVKGKITSSSSRTTSKKTTIKKREKKVYSLPGQKFDVPEEREPLRIFYESLSKQIPSSEMAEFWMMEHGMLSTGRAKKAYEKKQLRQKQLRMGTPIKSPPPLPRSKPEISKKQQQVSKIAEVKVKKRIIESDDDDEFILSPKRRKG